MIRRCFVLLTVAALCLGGQAGAQSGDGYPVKTMTGVVQSLDFGNQEMIVSGTRYQVAMDAEVEIGGSFGAFTMLTKGMKIYYEYLLISPSSRRIIKIRELGPDEDVGAV